MGGAKGLERYLEAPIDILVSYYGSKKIVRLPFYADLFLDSGAFSAFRKKEILDPLKYAEFVKTWKDEFFVYAGLDVIGDPFETYKNQMILEKQNLMPLPCFHFGEDIKWLKRYLKKYEYIAIGGLVSHSRNWTQMLSFLDRVWDEILKISPEIKVHGFGVQDEELIKRFPWFSVDATSVHMQARYGGIRTPWGWIKINPEVNYKEVKWQTPIQLTEVKKWVNSLGLNFHFDEAQPSTTEATLMRCAISVKYYDNLFGSSYEYKKPKYIKSKSFSL